MESRSVGKLTIYAVPGKVAQSLSLRPITSTPMKPPKPLTLKSRTAEKAASRREDRQRLESGESPEVIQRENSIFPPGYFDNLKFSNLADVVGK